ncbi:MAG: hypothetical protein VYD22_00970, partial [Gemmatimonadota bacterium]|nr:hypothetical protein [Gemmatimonadota bacterium]
HANGRGWIWSKGANFQDVKSVKMGSCCHFQIMVEKERRFATRLGYARIQIVVSIFGLTTAR